MKAIIYKKFNGKDYVLMETHSDAFKAQQRAGTLRAKYGSTRVVKSKEGKYEIYCIE